MQAVRTRLGVRRILGSGIRSGSRRQGGSSDVAMDPVHDISPGRAVYSQDGHELGTVKEVRGGLIKIDAPLQPDYWLRRSDVLSYTNERVTFSFDRSALDTHKHHEPD
jgi:hypothetical protein